MYVYTHVYTIALISATQLKCCAAPAGIVYCAECCSTPVSDVKSRSGFELLSFWEYDDETKTSKSRFPNCHLTKDTVLSGNCSF